MPHSHEPHSRWAQKKKQRIEERRGRGCLRCRDLGEMCPECRMWRYAYQGQGEIVAREDYGRLIHPRIPVERGDVLLQGPVYAHPALTTPKPPSLTDP